MAKAPRPGLVKTRLETTLGADGCARLQAALLRNVAAIAVEAVGDAVFVAYAPGPARDEVAALVPSWVGLLPQRGDGLGERLAAATGDVFRRHGGPLAVVGTDVPVLDAERIREAFTALAGGSDVCLGPARDGGYYLIAMRQMYPELLQGIPWGTEAVFEMTYDAARRLGLRVRLLPRLSDVDRPEDLDVWRRASGEAIPPAG